MKISDCVAVYFNVPIILNNVFFVAETNSF